jgi:hypothetical protein
VGKCPSCVAGKYQSQAAQTKCIECSAGKFQPTDAQSNCNTCSGGKYGATRGLTTSNCSGLCKEGYYCSSGSKDEAAPADKECGVGTYCEEGSSIPQPASIGVYAYIDGDRKQHNCPEGHKCSNGNKTACSPGKYQPKMKHS